MKDVMVDVTAAGAVLLGESGVVCDGFLVDHAFRIQTHFHSDHMQGFDSSKGYQIILLTPETKALLVAQYNADLPYRCNVVELPYGVPLKLDSCRVMLLPSGHMLGAAQSVVELQNGLRIGYSGDFRWPLYSTIKVDILVVDSTYTAAAKDYDSDHVELRLVQLVLDRLSAGPIALRGNRGTLHRAVSILSEETPFPFLAAEDFVNEASVYQRFGHDLGSILCVDSDPGRNVIASGTRFVHVLRARDMSMDGVVSTTIDLGAHHSNNSDPVVQYSTTAYRVALSDHADLDGAIEYVRSTGAKSVITDNSRGGKAHELAHEIRHRLGIPARPSSNRFDRNWGLT